MDITDNKPSAGPVCPARTPYIKKGVHFLQLIHRKVRRLLKGKENTKVFYEERVNELRSI